MNLMKTSTAFRAITDNRRRAARSALESTANFAVKGVNKDGSLSKMAPSNFDLCETQEAADARCAELMRMNPGRTFRVVATKETV